MQQRPVRGAGMSKTQSSFALSDESKQLLAELAQRLGISQGTVLDLAIREYARRAGVASDPDASRSDVLVNRRHVALALGVSPHVSTQLYAQGRIRGVATSDGEMYSRYHAASGLTAFPSTEAILPRAAK